MRRTLLIVTLGLFIAASLPLAFHAMSPAAAAECSGENCPPPSGQGGGGGHDCEHEKKDDTVS